KATQNGPATLSLTADQINALLQDAGDAGPGAWVRVAIEADQAFAELSLPMRELGTEAMGLGDRYLNGRATLDLRVQHGRLAIYMTGLKVPDRDVPEDIMNRLRQQNFAIHLRGLPAATAALGKLDGVAVHDGKITL